MPSRVFYALLLYNKNMTEFPVVEILSVTCLLDSIIPKNRLLAPGGCFLWYEYL